MQHTFELISCTRINPFILDAPAAESDLVYWRNPSPFTPQEQLIEWAGRVCYRSTDKMGHAASFIRARLDEGHADIIEHVFVTIGVPTDYPVSPLLWRNFNPYCTVALGDRRWIVSGNLRVWQHLSQVLPGLEPVVELLAEIAPSVFASQQTYPVWSSPAKVAAQSYSWLTAGQARVTLLAANYPTWGHRLDGLTNQDWAAHRSATFFLENVSRSLTHQLVRHRKFSNSQESQRYVSLEKGGWEAIIPPAIANHPQALDVLQRHWAASEAAYTELRELGIRKEDARFLLPNAAATRIVVSSPFDGWQHFNELRALDKAAQWEIREVGQAILHLLTQVAPTTFLDQWNRLSA